MNFTRTLSHTYVHPLALGLSSSPALRERESVRAFEEKEWERGRWRRESEATSHELSFQINSTLGFHIQVLLAVATTTAATTVTTAPTTTPTTTPTTPLFLLLFQMAHPLGNMLDLVGFFAGANTLKFYNSVVSVELVSMIALRKKTLT